MLSFIYFFKQTISEGTLVLLWFVGKLRNKWGETICPKSHYNHHLHLIAFIIIALIIITFISSPPSEAAAAVQQVIDVNSHLHQRCVCLPGCSFHSDAVVFIDPSAPFKNSLTCSVVIRFTQTHTHTESLWMIGWTEFEPSTLCHAGTNRHQQHHLQSFKGGEPNVSDYSSLLVFIELLQYLSMMLITGIDYAGFCFWLLQSWLDAVTVTWDRWKRWWRFSEAVYPTSLLNGALWPLQLAWLC